MLSRDEILEQMRERVHHPAGTRELLQLLHIPREERAAFRRHLKNLVELATAERSIDQAEADVMVSDARRTALSMAVIAQVQIAVQRYALAQDNFKVAGRLYGVDVELSSVASGGAAASSGSRLESLTALSHKTVSELQYLIAYSDLQNAYGRILNSVGANRLPLEIEHQTVAGLKAEVRKLIDNWKIDLPTARFAAK